MRRSRFHTHRRTTSRAWLPQRTMWNGSRHSVAFSQAAERHVTDPLRGVGADQANPGCPLGAEEIEELLQRGPVVAGGGPHQPAAVVVDDDHQVLVAAPVGDLVDPDPHQPVERIPHGPGIDDDAAGDRPDTAPSDPHQLHHRRLRAVRDEPGDLIVEGAGVPGSVTGPRHRSDRHPVLRTRHPWRVGLDEHADRAGIQSPPAAPPLTLVVAAATPIAAPTATRRTPAQPARHDDLGAVVVVLDRLDDDPAFDAEHPRPYPLRLHPVRPRSLSSLRQPESQAGQRGAPADAQLPTHGTGRRARKVALVTGGSRGIGAATALALTAEGATVAITYATSSAQADAVVSAINTGGGRAIALRADQTDPAHAVELVDVVVADLGRLDILVNNAAITVWAPIDSDDVDHDALDRQLTVNYTSVVALIRSALRVLPDGGRIINIGSGAGTRVGVSGMTDYTATKAALAGYTRGAARDLAHRNITVNIIQPGVIDTDMNPADGAAAALFLPSVPLGRYGRPEEDAAGVVFYASPGASYITGTTLNIDGGIGA